MTKCSGVCDMHHISTIKNVAYIIIQVAAGINPRLDMLRAASSSQGHSKDGVIVSHKDHIPMSYLSYVLYHWNIGYSVIQLQQVYLHTTNLF